MRKFNPLSGRTGQGPPIAPTGWLWRAGRRPSDMYFYSPTGQKFSSRVQVQSYIDTIPDPPLLSSFRWKVEPEEFKDGLLPGVPPEDMEPYEKSKSPKIKEASVSKKRKRIPIKTRTTRFHSKKKKSKKIQVTSEEPTDIARIPETQTHGMIVEAQVHSEGIQEPEHIESDAHEEKIVHRTKKETSEFSFRQLLSSARSSRKLLKKSETLRKFLDEAARLKEKSEQEIDELRNVLIYIKHDATRLSRYSDSVLQVFFFLLRNEEPPANITRERLIELCGKWICKHKHFWCYLETRRLEASETSCLYAKKNGQMKHFTPFSAKGNNVQMPEKPYEQSTSLDLEVPNHSIPCQTTTIMHEDTQGLACKHGNRGIDSSFIETVEPSSECALSSDQFVYSKGMIEAQNAENDFRVLNGEVSTSSMGIGNEPLQCCNAERIEMDAKDIIFTEEDLQAKPEDSCLSKETIQKELEFLFATADSGREIGQTFSEQGQREKYNGTYSAWPEKCGCQVCSRDPSFCYGCTCIHCKAFIQYKESWTFIKCSICNHVCHLECALKDGRAGVVERREIDGEFLCSCCLHKSDLVPFWMKTVSNALTSIDTTKVQICLASAVLVLNNTKRQDLQEVHESLMELHASLFSNTPCPHLQQILEQIQEKVDGFKTLFDDSAHLDVQDAEIREEEEKVREGHKQADRAYVEWLMAEKNVGMQRLLLRDLQEKMKNDELDLSSKASHARASRAGAEQAEIRLQRLKRISIAKVSTKEQIEHQQVELDMELGELNKLQKELESVSPEHPTHSSLLEELKAQSKRIDDVKSTLEYMGQVVSFLS